jgi:hypothetical protein
MTTQRTLTPIDQAIDTHMLLIEHHLVDMLENINEARHALNYRSRNGAVGTLLQCKEAYSQIGALYEAIIALHHHSDIIERPEE